MKTASVADLRNNFPRIAGWLEAGEVVRITKRGKHIADLRPARKGPPVEAPDFMARLRDLYESEVPDTYDLLDADREDPA